MDALYLVFGVFLFIAVVLLVEGAYLMWNTSKGPEAKRIARRLRLMSAGTSEAGEEVSILKSRMLSASPAMERLLLQVPRVKHLDRLLEQSGLTWSVAELLGMMALSAVAGAAVAFYFGMTFLLTLVAAVIMGALPIAYVFSARGKRMVKVELQLPDALDLVGRALRAGHAFPTAVKMVSDELNDPIGGEFRTLFDEVNYGVSMHTALLNLAARIPVTDLRYFVIAVLIQRETGGNLAELLDNIAAIIRARLKLFGQIRVLSAEGRLSAWILTLLPIGVALIMNLVNPGYIGVLWKDPMGLRLVTGAVLLMIFGIFWMWRIVKIHV
jgi:tight adherence protein B